MAPGRSLLTREGALAVRRARVLGGDRWLRTVLGSLMTGCVAGLALALTEHSADWALAGGAVVAISVFAFYVVASAVLGRPVVPEIASDDHDRSPMRSSSRWDTEAEAAEAARMWNLRDGYTGRYWIEVEIQPRVWAIESRYYERPSPSPRTPRWG